MLQPLVVSNHKYSLYLHSGFQIMLDVLLQATEVDIQFMEMRQKDAEQRCFRHLRKGVDILGEAFATITKLTIRTRHIGMGVVDVAREKHTRMHLAPVTAHLLTILTTGI